MNKTIYLTNISFVFFLVFLQGCLPFKPYESTQEVVWTDIPMKRIPIGNVELFFEDDEIPDKQYIEVGEIAVNMRGRKKSRQLAELLKKKAAEKGMDAVAYIERDNFYQDEVTFGEVLLTMFDRNDDTFEESSVNYSELRGIGLKFVENINYLDKYVALQEAFTLEKDSNELVYTKHFRPNGVFDEIRFYADSAEHYHDNIINHFSLEHLVYEEENWVYQKESTKLLARRLVRLNDWVEKACRFKYDERNRISEILVLTKNKKYKERIKLQYNHLNPSLVSEKLIQRPGKTKLIEKLEYSDDWKLKKKTIYKLSKGKQQPYFVVHYHYFSNDDLPKLLEEEKQRSVQLNE
ncbi:hypothetical protein QQ008_17600 [Fulvivirgaceae bacterium BMA10]|uniref:Uncharacterized protein n=1 Tax=Splendidivirga corallicola TaxID=3051826 RepID=A0ABT8KR37_9BACT|nr:hypothetical protein [Fulvivirgaceae bacterium BMA10]